MDWKKRKEELISEGALSNKEQIVLLNEMQKLEYQYGLVMKSLVEYTDKFNEYDKKVGTTIIKLNKKVENLKDSNEYLNSNMKEVIKGYEKELHESLTKTNEYTNRYIEELRMQTTAMNKRHDNILKRSELIDKIVMVYIIATPILFLLILFKLK